MFSAILTQSVTLAYRKGGGAAGGLAFYVIVFCLFTFALSPEGMKANALPVLSVAMLLASIIAIPSIFERDAEEGFLEQYLLRPLPLELVVLAKLLGLWAAQLLPILLMTPLLCLMAGLNTDHILPVLWRLLLLSPSIAAIAVFTAAITLGARRDGILPALVSLPLTVPLVIFAAGIGGQGALLLLAAFALASVPLTCFVGTVLVRLTD